MTSASVSAAVDRPRSAGAVRPAPRTWSERDALLAELTDPAGWPRAAAALLADLGFRLVQPEALPGGDSHLLIALRRQPTFRHFDPESVTYYARTPRGTEPTTMDRRSLAAGSGRLMSPALWGHVHVLDRLPVENRFLMFGGELRAEALDPGLTVVDLCSPAPIVRWGGHSQGTDALAEAIGAFFGRLIVPVDFDPGAEERVDGTPPAVLYRAFLADMVARRARAARRGAVSSDLDGWLARAWRRARSDLPATEAALELLADLKLGPAA